MINTLGQTLAFNISIYKPTVTHRLNKVYLPGLIKNVNVPAITSTSCLTAKHVEIMTFMIPRMKTLITE